MLRKVVADFDIRPPNPMALFGRLSGGNQQKTILAKWLLLRPSVLVLDDPTNGVDPHARRTIFELLRELTASGHSILFYSSDNQELAHMCDRVLAMSRGRVAATLDGERLTESHILRAAFGVEDALLAPVEEKA